LEVIVKSVIKISMTVLLLGTTLGAGSALAFTGEKYAHEAKISMAQATDIALKTQPGKVTDSELERESGGSGLRYSFDIQSGNDTHEVGVDAKTGKVLENSVEGPNAD